MREPIIGQNEFAYCDFPYLGIGQLIAEHIDITHGTLLKIKGDERIEGGDHYNIKELLRARKVNAKHVIFAEALNSFDKICRIKEVDINSCDKLSYGLLFRNSVCQIGKVNIQATTVENTQIHADKKDLPKPTDEDLYIGEYLFNYPYTEPRTKKEHAFTFGEINISNTTTTNIMELSTQDNDIRINKSLNIKKNEFENGMDILESNFNMKNVSVTENKIGKIASYTPISLTVSVNKIFYLTSTSYISKKA